MSAADPQGAPGEAREVLFDLSEEYEAMLDQGLRLSGENRTFFEVGRVAALERELQRVEAACPRRILDFGCGTGSTSRLLAARFPDSEVLGVDLAEPAIARARVDLEQHEELVGRVHFETVDDLGSASPFDLCYCSGVFHHIAPSLRPRALDTIRGSLCPRGLFALFENNPWNPGTRWVMSRIPFDRDAITLSPLQARTLLRTGGFEVDRRARSLFYFPKALAALRPMEHLLEGIPLGAQYWLLARLAVL